MIGRISNIAAWFCVFFILLFCLLILKKNQKITYQNNDLKQALIYQHEEDSLLCESINKAYILSIQNQGFDIDKNMLFMNEQNATCQITDIQFDNYLLVFRFNELTCNDCIYSEMGNIERFSEKYGIEDIIILASYSNSRYLYYNKRMNRLHENVYNMPIGQFVNGIDSLNVPYMFVLDNNYKASNIFIPNKYAPHLTQRYLEAIKYLFNN